MKDTTLHMIGNAHIDPVWLWQWQEGFQETLATFRSALDRMAETPEFRFTASSAALYAWVERIDPAMFEEIRARVAEGRWEIAGGWWIEPDCNIPGGESFVRQALYGQRYFQKAFGVTAHVGYAVDSFGHHAVLPQILKASGLDFYVFMRPGPHEKGLPGRLFWWEADDGSRVLTFRIPFTYTSWGHDLEPHIRRCAAEMKPPVDTFMCFYGVGNHGGGPTGENIASIQRLNGDPELPALAFSTTGAFFDAVGARDWPLPVVHDELQHHASGCYAAHSGIKRWNRQAESALQRAETWSTVAARVTGLPYPKDTLTHAWKDVLFNQFHDIMAGSSLEEAYADAQRQIGEATTIADRAANDAFQSLAWHMVIPHEEDAKPIVVFNTNAWASRAPVELEAGRVADDAVLTDDTGLPVPIQRMQSHATAGGRARIAFIADLPATGYRVYRLGSGSAHADSGEPTATSTTLENPRFRLTFDPETGYLVSLYDKAAETEVLAGPAARPVVIDDPSDTWSHDVFRFDQEIGAFHATRIQVVAQGPVKAVLRVESAWGNSTLVQDFTLHAAADRRCDLDRIDVHVTVDWHEHHKLLKLRFPVAVHGYKVTHEIPYGHIERFPNGEEFPIQRWVDISGFARTGAPYGMSLLNDGKPSVDVLRNEIGMTVLRSPVYAHHDPVKLDHGSCYTYMDQGVQTFTYSLYPHLGSWEAAGTVRRSAELNQPPVALIATGRPAGTLPLSASYTSAEPPTVIVTVLKQAEDGDDLVIRAYETAGAATHATIVLPGWSRTLEADFRPGEVKTWRVPADGGAVEVSLLEE
ncbi:MAG: glycosyl hydrolase-related protein [Anaerolineae bacterium]|nr:glycosyl hydrolase-related protein [Anaerolineae bacterium]